MGFRADEKVFLGSVQTSNLGVKFQRGDVIGAGIQFSEKKVFATLNGKFIKDYAIPKEAFDLGA